MYLFKSDISVDEFTAFTEKISFAPIQQTKEWTQLKSNWKNSFCGLYKDGELVGVALILMRTLLPSFTYAYCPRGPLLDYTDKEALAVFTDGIRKFCKEKGVYLLKCDPMIVVGKTLPELSKDKYFDPFDTEKGKLEFDNFVSCGFVHKGFGKSLDSATQPRYNALIPLKDGEGNPLTAPQFKKNYKQKLRKYLGNFQPARGLFYESADHSAESIALFKKILSNTEARQNISLRNEDYFQAYAERLSLSPRLDAATKDRYAYIAATSRINAVGTKAADFVFSDKNGRERNLYGIKADHILLFFSNPGCDACMEIINGLRNDAKVNQMIKDGALAVLNIYIDEDIQAWRDYMEIYPQTWYNGFDPHLAIRNDMLYNVRAIPSLYLLDSDKIVILKDAVPEKVSAILNKL